MASASKEFGIRSNNANAAASLIEIPSRVESNGLQGPREVSCRAWNPYSVVRHSESTPPTTAASMRSASIIRLADPNTLALEEQAEQITTVGPSRSNACRTKSATENEF